MASRVIVRPQRRDDGAVRVDLKALGRRVMPAISAAIVGLDIGNEYHERLQHLIGGSRHPRGHRRVVARRPCRKCKPKRIYGQELVRPALKHRRAPLRRTPAITKGRQS